MWQTFEQRGVENSEEQLLPSSPRGTTLKSRFSKENPTRMRNHVHVIRIYSSSFPASFPLPSFLGLHFRKPHKSVRQALLSETQVKREK